MNNYFWKIAASKWIVKISNEELMKEEKTKETFSKLIGNNIPSKLLNDDYDYDDLDD